MADGVNKAILVGNLGEEPEFRMTQNNRPVLKFRIATTQSYKGDDGQWNQVTHWHRLVLWGKRAESLSSMLTKGSHVYVEGRIETRTYDDKDGVKRSITEINVGQIVLLDKREAGEKSASGSGRGAVRPATQGKGASKRDATEPPDGPELESGADDEIPF